MTENLKGDNIRQQGESCRDVEELLDGSSSSQCSIGNLLPLDRIGTEHTSDVKCLGHEDWN